MIINTAVVIGVFLIGFVGVAWMTWPDVPWTGILVGTIAANAIIPVLFYPCLEDALRGSRSRCSATVHRRAIRRRRASG